MRSSSVDVAGVQSVETIKAWLDIFHQIPASTLIGQPFHFWLHMILYLTLLKYLSNLQHPDWDCQAVRNAVSPRMLQTLELSSKEPEIQRVDDQLLHFISKLLARCRL
ncbi:uncharacterized protein BP01DRAFT_388874 [Aspergillus saccharolyticus JOP 1030-1]|uniref:Uncharacterized protein n=1 Tax=Aspergillus saccharolyticus JOP 1030-1 TaxID=1450539 RepID=A0A318ZQX2_9EURO|nr:hypothetical protein BP01DRAFT_388874 [Aspergillus saccharolyticus JOP 1030-1]PYH49045.1 hypothetical protein BP01DRAFT_388874 [Aspergillus saccharolyticus JOP 1030-1]